MGAFFVYYPKRMLYGVISEMIYENTMAEMQENTHKETSDSFLSLLRNIEYAIVDKKFTDKENFGACWDINDYGCGCILTLCMRPESQNFLWIDVFVNSERKRSTSDTFVLDLMTKEELSQHSDSDHVTELDGDILAHPIFSMIDELISIGKL